MNASPCRLFRAAVLLAGLAVAAPTAAQAEDPSAGPAHKAAEQWARKLIESLQFRGELPPDALKRMALQPLNPREFGLSDRNQRKFALNVKVFSGDDSGLVNSVQVDNVAVASLPAPSGVTREPARREFRDCEECPEMVVVAAGEYMMGSPRDEAGRDDGEGPRHRVRIGEAFAVGKYEVTRGEYGEFVRATGHDGRGCWAYDRGEMIWKEEDGRSWQDPGYEQGENHPAVCVSWEDAKEYVRWLSRETGKEYRLLSEGEWEYVARAGAETRYTWGDDVGENRANCAGCGSEWDGERTAPVGSFGANRHGLHDLHGNVWEWVRDCYGNYEGNYEGAPDDGRAWESGDCSHRVLRGGSWDYGPGYLRSASRVWSPTGTRGNNIGFRVARTLTR